MRLVHELDFELQVPMPFDEALAFVRDVPRSFAKAAFLQQPRFDLGPPPVLSAELPVAAAFFGQRSLPFRSMAEARPSGGALVGVPIEVEGPGWAQVDAEVGVLPLDGHTSSLRYQFSIQVWLRLPEAEGWGGRALQRMIERAGREVLRRLDVAFPQALQEAAAADAPPTLRSV